MRLRPWLYTFILFWIGVFMIGFWLSDLAEGQEVTVGTLGDKPINLISTTEGSNTLTVGTIGNKPVNSVGRSTGKLVARIHYSEKSVKKTAPKKRGGYFKDKSDRD